MKLIEILKEKKYNTDKHTNHKYIQDFYEKLFEPYMVKKINFLEIGVLRGESLKLWCDYFEDAKKIVGIDIFIRTNEGGGFNDVKRNLSDYDVKLYELNSCEDTTKHPVELFTNFKKENSDGFDVLIDDGDHNINAQIKTFKRFSKLMNKGGLYIIEDIGQYSSEQTHAKVDKIKSEIQRKPEWWDEEKSIDIKKIETLETSGGEYGKEICMAIYF